MLYQPSPERLPWPEESIETDRSARIDQLRMGYAYACLGSALTLIEQTEGSDKQAAIMSTHGDVDMWSAGLILDDSRRGETKLTLIYELQHDEVFAKDTLFMLWVAQPRLIGGGRGYLFTWDDEDLPQVHYFTEKRGWTTPSARQLKKLFHQQLMPAQQDEDYVGRPKILRDEEFEVYRYAMKRFTDVSRGEN